MRAKIIKLFSILTLISTTSMAKTLDTKYEVIKKITDSIEIREYQDLTLITTHDKDCQTENQESSKTQNKLFRPLFNFITGNNSDDKKYNMTTPVFAKVQKGCSSLSFVIANEDNEKIPAPNDKEVEVSTLKSSKFIVIRFSGRAIDKNFAKYETILREEIEKQGIRADLSQPIRAYYNAPWTLPFLKRNEVMFRVKKFLFI